ncbi:MAG: 16S rRNA processing protein RimM [Candidatus Tokpelaia sp. JSC161]|jgi:16S rRNA processing protein RimM|nr:MAG: 16S rRNA processing protein RimM [Candidatus Tokpelaia sp. JSC161]
MSKSHGSVLMAVIGSAHGIDGDVRVQAFTENPLALGDYGFLYDKIGSSYKVASLRLQKKDLIVRFKEIRDRAGAEARKGVRLFIHRAQLPALKNEEFYQEDLLGLVVLDLKGNKIGDITAIFNFGCGDLLEVLIWEGQKKYFIPFTKVVVLDIDLISKNIIVDPVAAGL